MIDSDGRCRLAAKVAWCRNCWRKLVVARGRSIDGSARLPPSNESASTGHCWTSQQWHTSIPAQRRVFLRSRFRMSLILFPLGLILILVALYDGFETMVLPRRVTRVIRPARLYYRTVWKAWTNLARLFPAGKQRNNFLSVFGPLSLIGLFI